jgi:hypothetical protein
MASRLFSRRCMQDRATWQLAALVDGLAETWLGGPMAAAVLKIREQLCRGLDA